MTELTKNFTWVEVSRSRHADEQGIDNTIPEQFKPNAILMAARMEEVRIVCGDLPVSISSWYRTPVLNKFVGGSTASAHMEALAVDFHVVGMTLEDAFKKIRASSVRYDQLLIERGKDGSRWLHIGLFRLPRREAMTVSWSRELRRMIFTRLP